MKKISLMFTFLVAAQALAQSNAIPAGGAGNGGDAVRWPEERDGKVEKNYSLDLFEIGIHKKPHFDESYFKNYYYEAYRNFIQRYMGSLFSKEILDLVTLKLVEARYLNRPFALALLGAVQEFSYHSSPAELNPIDDEYLGHQIPRERLIQAAGRRLDRVSFDEKLFFGLEAEQMVFNNQPSLITHELSYILNPPRSKTVTVITEDNGKKESKTITFTLQDSVEARSLNAHLYEKMTLKDKRDILLRKLKDYGYARYLSQDPWHEEGFEENGRPYLRNRLVLFAVESLDARSDYTKLDATFTRALTRREGNLESITNYCQVLKKDFKTMDRSDYPRVFTESERKWKDKTGEYHYEAVYSYKPKSLRVSLFRSIDTLLPAKSHYIDRRGNKEFVVGVEPKNISEYLNDSVLYDAFLNKAHTEVDVAACVGHLVALARRHIHEISVSDLDGPGANEVERK